MKLDVTSVTEVREMVDKIRQKYGRIDVLVNNAGYPIKDDLWDVRFDQIPDEVLERVLDVDTKGTYRCCREVLLFNDRKETWSYNQHFINPCN